MLLQNTSYTAI